MDRGKLWTVEDSSRLGERVIEIILDRTARGISSNGERFSPKRDGSKSVLRDTGRLLQSLRFEASDDGVVIKAGANYAIYVEEARPFLGLTNQEEKGIADEIERTLATRIESILDGGRR